MDNPVDEESRANKGAEGYPRVSRQFIDTSETEGDFEPKIGLSDGEKLLKASLERRAQNATPVRSNAVQRNTIPDPDDAALDDRMANSSGPRMARMKKIRSRRDRITVVQNPATPSSPKQMPAPSSPSPSQKSGSASSTPRTSPSKRTQSSPVRQGSPSGSLSSSERSCSAGRHPSRERVAGGAAAKLIGPKTEDEYEEEEIRSNQSASEAQADFSFDIDEYSHLTELDQVRRKARVEYDIGTEENRRYKLNWDTFDSDDEDKDDLKSEATLPSILDRSEVFHENATAAIIALLNPKGKRHETGSVVSGHSGMPLSPASIGADSSAVSPSRGVGSPTHNLVSGRLSTTSTKLIKTPTSTLSPENREWQPHEVGAVSALDAPQIAKTKVPNQPLLTATAEQKLELMKKAMIDPSKTLAELLTAIATPPEGENMDQAYMVRRKNACGALKVLTAKEANRRTIGWTLGVYPALASVLHDGGEGKLEDTFPDERIRNEYFEARNRAVSALLNLCLLKENRIPIFHCPGLLHGLAKTIMQDTTEARQGCTAVLGFLAKTPENRLLLVKVPGILDALNSAIKPWSPEGLEDSPERKTKKFVWDSTSGSYSMTTCDSPSQNFSTDKGTTDEDSATESSQSGADDVASYLTPQMTTSPTSLSLASRRSFLYDNDPNKFVNGTRHNVFATLLHVVKEKDNAFHIARHPDLLFTMVDLSYMHESPSHTHAIQIICNLTRHRGNSKLLVFNNRIVVPAMVYAMSSPSVQSRTFACRSLQNLSQDKSCRQDIAITKGLVESLVQKVSLPGNEEEKLAAVSTLKNLADEPTNLIPMTNTPNCFATLMKVAHGQDGSTTELMQFLACDALATLSHWLRKIASTEGSLEAGPANGAPKLTELMNPSLQVVTFEQWA